MVHHWAPLTARSSDSLTVAQKDPLTADWREVMKALLTAHPMVAERVLLMETSMAEMSDHMMASQMVDQ